MTFGALIALAVAALIAWLKKKGEGPGDNALDPGNLLGLADLTVAKVTLRCLWCGGDAFAVTRKGLLIGNRDEQTPCDQCGRVVTFVTRNAEGVWWVS